MSKTISEELHKVLQTINRPGSFCMSGGGAEPMPGLVVTGLGPIGLPLTASQAAELKTHCRQAPYGKGEKTIVDTSVRQVWQLTPDQFSLTNPDWTRFLTETTKKVEQELGLEGQKLGCHLYNLLLYEPGDFFLPHRDGEKLDRMVATLVVVLPSIFQGGELVVRHEGQEKVIDFGTPDRNPYYTQFAAFYADCEHEVRPLREGYRLCLIYNLTLTKAKKTITAPRTGDSVEQVATVLRSWGEDGPTKLVVPLEHQYTKDGLVWDALKGVDRVRAKVLSEAAGRAGCRAYLALLTFKEDSAVEEMYEPRSRRRRYDDDDDEEDDEEGEIDSSDYEIIEVIESSLTAEHFSDPTGEQAPLGEMEVDEEEIVPPEALKKVKPEEEVEGYTGNEGLTLTRWYRHAAIFLWPESHHFDVVCDSGSEMACVALEGSVMEWWANPRTDADSLKARSLALAGAIIRRCGSSLGYQASKAGKSLSTSLAKLDDPKLLGEFLKHVVAQSHSLEIDPTLTDSFDRHGWPTFRNELGIVFDNTKAESLLRSIQLLEQIAAVKPRQKAEWLTLCADSATKIERALYQIDRESVANDWRLRESRAKVLAGFVRALIATEQSQLLADIIRHTIAATQLYPLPAHIEALTSLKPWLKAHVKKHSDAMSDWLAACRERLESLTQKQPTAPTDFVREMAIACNCRDCEELKQFLKNPNEKVHRFRMAEKRRVHLQQRLSGENSDVRCTTEEVGSPYTLVCSKTTNSFEAKLKTYHLNRQHLATIKSIESNLPK